MRLNEEFLRRASATWGRRPVSTGTEWAPRSMESADLAAGLRAARTLQLGSVPPRLSKQLAGYILRVATELTGRGIDVDRLLDDGARLTGMTLSAVMMTRRQEPGPGPE